MCGSNHIYEVHKMIKFEHVHAFPLFFFFRRITFIRSDCQSNDFGQIHDFKNHPPLSGQNPKAFLSNNFP